MEKVSRVMDDLYMMLRSNAARRDAGFVTFHVDRIFRSE